MLFLQQHANMILKANENALNKYICISSFAAWRNKVCCCWITFYQKRTIAHWLPWPALHHNLTANISLVWPLQPLWAAILLLLLNQILTRSHINFGILALQEKTQEKCTVDWKFGCSFAANALKFAQGDATSLDRGLQYYMTTVIKQAWHRHGVRSQKHIHILAPWKPFKNSSKLNQPNFFRVLRWQTSLTLNIYNSLQ